MGCLTAKLVDRLTAKLVNHLTAKLVNRLTAKLVDRLTAKLEVASQPLDRKLPPWLANPRNPAMSPHSRHPSH